MVLGDHAQEVIKEMRPLALGQAVDVLDVVTNGEDALPAGDRVGADDWVLGGELVAHIKRRAPGFGVNSLNC